MRSLLVVLAFWGLATAVCAQHKTSSVQVNVVATTDTLRGFQLSLLNAANKTYGVQLSPLINVAHYLHGVQIGTMGNMATGSMRGVQLSAVNNMAGDQCVDGVHARHAAGRIQLCRLVAWPTAGPRKHCSEPSARRSGGIDQLYA